jgi:hypothetical protein
LTKSFPGRISVPMIVAFSSQEVMKNNSEIKTAGNNKFKLWERTE